MRWIWSWRHNLQVLTSLYAGLCARWVILRVKWSPESTLTQSTDEHMLLYRTLLIPYLPSLEPCSIASSWVLSRLQTEHVHLAGLKRLRRLELKGAEILHSSAGLESIISQLTCLVLDVVEIVGSPGLQKVIYADATPLNTSLISGYWNR